MNDKKTGKLFLKYLKNRDFDNIENLFSKDIVFQAVLPSKNPFRDVNNNLEAVGLLRGWFGDADKFKVKKSDSKHLYAERHHISYHIELHDSDGWQKVLQSFYCDIIGEKITSIGLNCSGFLPLNKN